MKNHWMYLVMLLSISAWLIGCSGSDNGDASGSTPQPQLGTGSADPAAMMDDEADSHKPATAPNGDSAGGSAAKSADSSAPPEQVKKPKETEEEIQ